MNDVRSSPRRLPSYSYSYSNSNSNFKSSRAKRLAVFGSHTLCLYSVYIHTFISLLVAWGPRQVSMTHAYSINVQPIINMHMQQAHLPSATEYHQNSTHLVESSWLCAHTHRPGPSAAAETVAVALTAATAAGPANWRSQHL